eukprot:CAMPEP_0174851374 /NCGR_PEP_ID=MMETSP1114-20130205/23160_1 /TAXON_ID=312471 /ORGANISM="Neobodo designis, Strain CCAP 1951/1" /LENGTH=276 /DNA_ID=CAMNT_0016085909 /DNA_START=40 /DNA_END=870 /DNA_ORIENTATION=+
MAGFDACGPCVCVKQSHVGFLEEMGKFQDVLPPGLTFINPCTQSLKAAVSLRLHQTQCMVSSTTKERMTLRIACEIMYRVIPSMAPTAYYSLSDPKEQISSFVESALRAELPEYSFDELYASKQAIAGRVQCALEQMIQHYGYEVVDLLLVEFYPPQDVIMSMNRQMTERYNRMAQASAAEIVRIENIKRAEAEAEQKRLQGVGSAEMQKGLSAGMESALALWNDGDHSSEVMALMLTENYMSLQESISRAKAGHKTVFVAGGLESGGSVLTHRTV